MSSSCHPTSTGPRRANTETPLPAERTPKLHSCRAKTDTPLSAKLRTATPTQLCTASVALSTRSNQHRVQQHSASTRPAGAPQSALTASHTASHCVQRHTERDAASAAALGRPLTVTAVSRHTPEQQRHPPPPPPGPFPRRDAGSRQMDPAAPRPDFSRGRET